MRASIEPVTEWDAVIYHVSFARDWIDSLPGLPHAAGPSVGAELSYNYPALFPSVSVVLAGALHLGVGAVARLVSPLAAITVLAVLRAVRPSALFAGWAAPMFLLGSTFFVAYGQWPTAYMLMTVLIVLAVARLVSERRLTPATALCIGLAAATGLIGVVFALDRPRRLRRDPARAAPPESPPQHGLSLPRATKIAASVAASRRSARRGRNREPQTDGRAALSLGDLAECRAPAPGAVLEIRKARDPGQRVRAVRRPGRQLLRAVRGIATSGLLAPGGLALAGVIVVGLRNRPAPRSRRVLLVGAGLLAGAVVASGRGRADLAPLLSCRSVVGGSRAARRGGRGASPADRRPRHFRSPTG